MALVVSALAAGIEGVFRARVPTGAQVGALLGSVYAIYAQTAQAGLALPVLLGGEGVRFGEILGRAFNPQVATPQSTAAAFRDALTAFWLSAPAPIIFTDGVNAGPVPAVPGAAALTGTLLPVFTNLANTEASAAQQIASALDAATRSIIVTLVPSNVPTPVT